MYECMYECMNVCMYRYLTSFFPRNKILAAGGNTGNVIYDFFIGR